MDDIQKVKLTIEGYDKIATMWDGTRRSDWPEVTSIIQAAILDLPGRPQIVDIGCGNGRILGEVGELISSKCASYLGIDVSNNLLQIAKDRYAHIACARFEVFDGINFDIVKDAKYDLLISTAVLHHIPPRLQRGWMQSLADMLRTGSIMIISVWHRSTAAQNFTISKEEIEGFAQLENIRYIYNFEEEELRMLLDQSGLKVTKFEKLKRPNSNNENWVIVASK